MAHPKIMVVDDEVEILELVSLFLERENYEVIPLQQGQHVIEKVEATKPDLLLLDILLSDTDGMEICQELRKFSDIPILFMSCKSEDVDKVIGLSVGGDDYITKPFSPIELVARVKAHLRRNKLISYNHSAKAKDHVLKFDNLEINLSSQTVRVNGVDVSLSSREFKLLTKLAQNPGRVYSMNALYELVWGIDGHHDTRTVMVHISNLRKKIEKNLVTSPFIVTVRGAGYKFNDQYTNNTVS